MKTNRDNGFTLMEMLIVVAIIGVLVAIAIPTFSSQLENARLAVDQANVRSAKASAMADWMLTDMSKTSYYVFDAQSGTCISLGSTYSLNGLDAISGVSVHGYGQSKLDSIAATDTLGVNGMSGPNSAYGTNQQMRHGKCTLSWSGNLKNAKDGAFLLIGISPSANGATVKMSWVFAM